MSLLSLPAAAGVAPLVSWTDPIRDLSIVAGVLFAVVLAARWWRRSEARARIERAAKAKSIYAGYLLQAMGHPELARPAPADTANARQRLQYQWFVGFLLTSAEEILLVDPSATWRDALARQLGPHREMLASALFRDGPYRNLSAEVKGLIDDVVAHGAEASARPSNVSPFRRGA